MTTARFDLADLYRAIDDRRAQLGLSWSAVSLEVGVSTSTIRRFEHVGDAEADGVLALIRWLGVAPETFVDGSARAGDALPAGDGMVRVDMPSIGRAVGEPTRGRRRTTIQRLVDAAQRAGVSISSLTRVAET